MDTPDTLAGAALAACGVLATVVGYLYRSIEKRLQQCEVERIDLFQKYYSLHNEFIALKKKFNGNSKD